MESKGINLTFSRLMKYKWVVVIGTLLSAALSVYVAMQQPNKYTAKVYLIPSNAKEGGGLNKLAGQFGGLASMAGISLGGSEADEIETAIEFMGSRGFIQAVIEKRNLLPELLALEKWDQSTNSYIYNPEVYDAEQKKWVRTPPPGKNVEPSPWEGYISLLGSFDILYMKKKGVVQLKVTALSPELAVNITNWLIEDINAFWRDKDRNEAEEAINYLQDKAAETNVAELRSLFYELIADQTRSKLLSTVGDFHLLKPLSPVIYPEEKSGPSRALICLGITFLGGLVSLIVSFLLALRKKA